MNRKLNSKEFEERVENLGNEPETEKGLGSSAKDLQKDSRTLLEKSLVGLYVIQRGRFSYVNSQLLTSIFNLHLLAHVLLKRKQLRKTG